MVERTEWIKRQFAFLYRNPNKGPMSDMVQDSESLFYAQMDSRDDWVLMKISKQGGEPTKLAPSISEVMQFVADEKSIYYFDARLPVTMRLVRSQPTAESRRRSIEARIHGTNSWPLTRPRCTSRLWRKSM